VLVLRFRVLKRMQNRFQNVKLPQKAQFLRTTAESNGGSQSKGTQKNVPNAFFCTLFVRITVYVSTSTAQYVFWPLASIFAPGVFAATHTRSGRFLHSIDDVPLDISSV